MNSSLSKMLDDQLLKADRTKPEEDPRYKKNESHSLTEGIFHGQKIYLQGGAMAFKPLDVQTKLETVGEEDGSWKPNILKKDGINPQTTEQNIEL